MTHFSLLAVPKLETTTPSFRQALVRRSLAAGLDPNFVAAAISYESGFNPRAKNPGSSATGILQWIAPIFPEVARYVGSSVTHADLPNLSAEEQLPFVIGYFQMKGVHKLSNARATDYYMAVLLPAFVGYAGTKVLARRGDTNPLTTASGKSVGISLDTMYVKNPSFDREGKGFYTVADVGRTIENLVAGARGRAPVLVPFPVAAPPRPRGSISKPASSSQPLDLPRFAPTGFSAAPREAAATLLPSLRRGSHGPAVMLLQRLLVETKAEGEETFPAIDGEFGAQTELHVALHQRDAHLETTGECDPHTWLSFCRDEFWGIDRIGVRVPEDPYGEPTPSMFAPTLHAELAHPTPPFPLEREAPTQRSPKKDPP